jgi:hypothetical protein
MLVTARCGSALLVAGGPAGRRGALPLRAPLRAPLLRPAPPLRRAAAARAMASAAPAPQAPLRRRVAVVGAGAAGLAALRELRAEGHDAVCFEQGDAPGGTWVYSDATDADPLGRANGRGSGGAAGRSHSSMYVGLRTNLPRELMSFTELPFTPGGMAAGGVASRDGRRFPSHAEVLGYLQAYAAHYGLGAAVRYGARVLRAAPVWGGGGGGGGGGAAGDSGGGGPADGSDDAEPVTALSGPRWEVTVEVAAPGGGRPEVQTEVGTPGRGGWAGVRRRGGVAALRCLKVRSWKPRAVQVSHLFATPPPPGLRRPARLQRPLHRHQPARCARRRGLPRAADALPQLPVGRREGWGGGSAAGCGATGQARGALHLFAPLCRCSRPRPPVHAAPTPAPAAPAAARSPERFAGQTVVIVGASNSGEDLCREIATTARRVLLCARSWKNTAWAEAASDPAARFGPGRNIERRGNLARLGADGRAEFETGPAVDRVDAVIYATGYRYEFPFLEGTVVSAPGDAPGDARGSGDAPGAARSGDDSGAGSSSSSSAQSSGKAGGAPPRLLSTAGQRVAPLYRHMYFPPLAPSLAFIGVRGLGSRMRGRLARHLCLVAA